MGCICRNMERAQNNSIVLEVRKGIEPLHSGFADRRVTSSPPHQQAHFITKNPLAGIFYWF